MENVRKHPSDMAEMTRKIKVELEVFFFEYWSVFCVSKDALCGIKYESKDKKQL